MRVAQSRRIRERPTRRVRCVSALRTGSLHTCDTNEADMALRLDVSRARLQFLCRHLLLLFSLILTTYKHHLYQPVSTTMSKCVEEKKKRKNEKEREEKKRKTKKPLTLVIGVMIIIIQLAVFYFFFFLTCKYVLIVSSLYSLVFGDYLYSHDR